jgi:GntR family transcriptional repressor for pyruvate dehydrogenase complex
LSEALREPVEDGELIVRPTRRRSLPQEIVDQLLELIAAQAGPELRLPPERVLCAQFAVSRTSLREALSALTHLGVLTVRGKSKFGLPGRARAHLVARQAANESERALITDPIEVRRMLEPEVAAKAAERASDRALNEIEHWLQLMEEGVKRGERVVEYDSAFHVSIARATENHTLMQVIAGLADAFSESRELSFWPAEAAERALAGHREILQALRLHEPDQAREAMRMHLNQVEDLLRATLDTRGKEESP